MREVSDIDLPVLITQHLPDLMGDLLADLVFTLFDGLLQIIDLAPDPIGTPEDEFPGLLRQGFPAAPWRCMDTRCLGPEGKDWCLMPSPQFFHQNALSSGDLTNECPVNKPDNLSCKRGKKSLVTGCAGRTRTFLPLPSQYGRRQKTSEPRGLIANKETRHLRHSIGRFWCITLPEEGRYCSLGCK